MYLDSGFVSLLSSFSCGQAVAAMTDPDITAQVVAVIEGLGYSREALKTLECNNSITTQDSCLLAGKGETFCASIPKVSFSEACCWSCSSASWQQGTSDWSDPSKFFFSADLPYAGEARALAEFLIDSRSDSFLAAHRRNFDLCQFGGIICYRTEYHVTLYFGEVPGKISPKVGALQHLMSLNVIPHEGLPFFVEDPRIPEELGNCSGLKAIKLRMRAEGAVPSSLSRLTKMAEFDVSENRLTTIDPDIFSAWPMLKRADLSNNLFTGLVPGLDFSVNSFVVSLNASSNMFSGMAKSKPAVCSSFRGLSLDLSNNHLTEIPESLRYMQQLSTLTLAHNDISVLPMWGYWQEAWSFTYGLSSISDTGKERPCFWPESQHAALAAPTWPILMSVDLSDNPIGLGPWGQGLPAEQGTWRRFLNLFSYASKLVVLRCSRCGLGGRIDLDALEQLKYPTTVVERDVNSTSDRMCKSDKSFTSLTVLDLIGNPAVSYMNSSCDILDITALADTAAIPLCHSCSTGSQVPVTGAYTAPLQDQTQCECSPTFVRAGKSSDGCGCADAHFYDRAAGVCSPCSEAFDCEWKGRTLRSIEIPSVRPGYWSTCVNASEDFSLKDAYSCASDSTCVGGSVMVASKCSGSSLCGQQRIGRACSECKAGMYSAPAGDCKDCPLGPGEVQRVLAIAAAVSLVALWPIMSLLTDETYRSGYMGLRSIKPMIKLFLRHMQILGVIGSVRLRWPSGVAGVLQLCQGISTQLGAALQLDCWASTFTAKSRMLMVWLVPLSVAALVMLSVLLSKAVAFALGRLGGALSRLASKVEKSLDTGFIVIHILWTIYFATIVDSILLVFSCRFHPGGDITISRFPDVTCGSGEFWTLAAGAIAAFLVYVVAFFAINLRTLSITRATLLDTNFASRGAFAFVTEGLRLPGLHYCLLVAAKDLTISAACAISLDPKTAVLVSAALTLVWTHSVLTFKPYDAWTTNAAEVWASGGTAALLVLTGFYGQGTEGGSTKDTEAVTYVVLSLLVVVASLLVPVLLILFELSQLVPCIVRHIPRSWLTQEPEQQRLQVEEFHKAMVEESNFKTCLKNMDAMEWQGFLAVLGERPGAARRQCCSFTRLLQDETMSSVRLRTSRSSAKIALEEDKTIIGTLRSSLRVSIRGSQGPSAVESVTSTASAAAEQPRADVAEGGTTAAALQPEPVVVAGAAGTQRVDL